MIDYKAKSKLSQDKKIDNDLFYINMHGSFNLQNGFKQIPPNIVLVFLTPVNRYSYICSKDSKAKIDETFNNPVLKNMFLNNILCIDKINDIQKNNRNYRSNFAFFENALVLLPGQYYCDLDLNYTVKDKTTYSVDITHYGKKNIENILHNSSKDYKSTLSAIIKSHIEPDIHHDLSSNKLSYVIVDCCRNLDHAKQDGTDIYIYENFMLYFNTIMFNCNNEVIKSTNLPVKQFKNFKLINIVKFPNTFLQYKTIIENSFHLYLNNNIESVIDEILNIISFDNPINLKEYIKINLLTNIKLIYDEKDPNQKVKIDNQIVYHFIIKLWNVYGLNNDNIDTAITYIKNIFDNINQLYVNLERKFAVATTNKDLIMAFLKENCLILRNDIGELLKINLTIQTEIKEPMATAILEVKELFEYLNKLNLYLDTKLNDLNNITIQLDLHADMKQILFKYGSNSKLILMRLINGYKIYIDNLTAILNTQLNTMLDSKFIDKRFITTGSGNKTLGSTGRNKLSLFLRSNIKSKPINLTHKKTFLSRVKNMFSVNKIKKSNKK
jgi:hypothetical protein